MSYLPLLKQRMADALRGLDDWQLADPSERTLAYVAAGISYGGHSPQMWEFEDFDSLALQFERRRRAALSNASKIAEGGIDE